MTELNFKGKEFVYNHHLAVPFRPLEETVDMTLILMSEWKAKLPIYLKLKA